MAEKNNPRVAYLAGILDGFRLARAETQDEAEELIDAIRKGDIDARIRAARAEATSRQASDDADEPDERDPGTRLN
jgi:hypothetical protein